MFGADNYLISKSTRQYLYKITPMMPVRVAGKVREGGWVGEGRRGGKEEKERESEGGGRRDGGVG